MLLKSIERLLILVAIALLVVIFTQNIVSNPALLDWVVPIVAGVGFVMWLMFRSPHREY